MVSSKGLQVWYKSTDDLAKEFIQKYFTDEEGDIPEGYWVADKIGFVLAVNDYSFTLNDVITALENNATFKQIDQYYQLYLEAHYSGKKIANFENFLKYNLTYID